MSNSPHKRLALITGGTSGIGFGIAKQLAKSCNLALGYADNHVRAETSLKELSSMNDRSEIRIYPGKLLQYEDARKLVAAVKNDFHKTPEILIHCAGHLVNELFLGSDFAQYKDFIDAHLMMNIALVHLVLPQMYANKFGRIINMSTSSAHLCVPGLAVYGAAKAAVENFTKTIALETAHRGITANTIAPGLIETPMIRATPSGIRRTVPAGFVGTPDDVGHVAEFLCSDKARYITGAVIAVDGGISLGNQRVPNTV